MIAEVVLSRPMVVEVIIGGGNSGGPSLPGEDGDNGLSAYEVAVLDGGFKGTTLEWLASLKGNDGKSLEFTWNGTRLGIRNVGDANYTYVDLKGASAYDVAVSLGFVGTPEAFIASLKGLDGHTPVISILPNGNWAIERIDTGTRAKPMDGYRFETYYKRSDIKPEKPEVADEGGLSGSWLSTPEGWYGTKPLWVVFIWFYDEPVNGSYVKEIEGPFPVLEDFPAKGASSSMASDHATSPEVQAIHITPEKEDNWNGIEERIKGGVDVNGDTLYKLKALVDNLKTFVNGDDVNLDSVKELADYIKANKALIDQVTTNKVNTADVVNALDCVVAGKVLDGRQGKVLKGLIDGLSTTLSNITTDSVAEGANRLYFTEGRVRNSILTGISFLVNQAISATDTFLGALGKLQAQITTLGTNKLDSTLEQGKVWIGGSDNKPTPNSVINEWTVGSTQPGQKEVMGLMLKMIVSDGSSIAIPIVQQKAVVLTAAGQIPILTDTYAGKYYVIKSAYLVARNLSGVTQYPTVSIGCNGTWNDIAASQTLNTLANGVNAITLTSLASKAIIEANANMFLNITTPVIGQGTFIIVLEGVLC